MSVNVQYPTINYHKNQKIADRSIYVTNFNKFVPLKYDLYHELKVLKAVYNISYQKSRRLKKWARKDKNRRIEKKPEVFHLFHYDFEKTYRYLIEHRGDRGEMQLKWAQHHTYNVVSTGIGEVVYQLFQKCQPKDYPDEVETLERKNLDYHTVQTILSVANSAAEIGFENYNIAFPMKIKNFINILYEASLPYYRKHCLSQSNNLVYSEEK